MKNKSISFLLSICLSFVANYTWAQVNLFTKVYASDNLNLQANAITKTMDTGFMLAGIVNDQGMYLKMNSLGDILWSKGLNNYPVMSEFRDVISTHDSCFILAGTVDFYSEYDAAFILLKINDSGDTIWSKTTSLPGGATLNALVETDDHGLIAIGSSYHYTSEPNNSIAVKYDSAGAIEWSYNYSLENMNLKFSSVKQLSDGSFIITGDYYNIITHRNTLTIIKLSENGSFEWAKSPLADTFYSSYGLDVEVVEDGLVFFYHYIQTTYNYRTSLIKTDFSGNFVWGKNYDFIHYANYMNDQSRIYQSGDGGLIVVNQNWGGVLLKTDASGNPEWIQDLFLNPFDVAETENGGYIVAGNGPLWGVKLLDVYNPQIGIIGTDSLGNGSDCIYLTNTMVDEITFELEDFILTRSQAGSPASYIPEITDFSIPTQSGCVAYIGGVNETDLAVNKLRIFPNPTTGVFSVVLQETPDLSFEKLTVLNINGKTVYQTIDPSCLRNGINPGYLPEGMYLVRMISGNSAYSGKLLINHK